MCSYEAAFGGNWRKEKEFLIWLSFFLAYARFKIPSSDAKDFGKLFKDLKKTKKVSRKKKGKTDFSNFSIRTHKSGKFEFKF